MVCQLDEFRGCLSISDVKQVLQSLPKTLDETYSRALLKIPSKYSKTTLRILQWLVFSKRPMLVREIAEILIADPDDIPEFSEERRLFGANDILVYCGNLVTFQPPYDPHFDADYDSDQSPSEADDAADYESEQRRITSQEKEIRLAHFSVQEFLLSDRIHKSESKKYSLLEQSSHASITRTCLVYLMDGPFSVDEYAEVNEADLAEKTHEADDVLDQFPLTLYAANHWTEHAKDADDSQPSDMRDRIIRLLELKMKRLKWEGIVKKLELRSKRGSLT